MMILMAAFIMLLTVSSYLWQRQLRLPFRKTAPEGILKHIRIRRPFAWIIFQGVFSGQGIAILLYKILGIAILVGSFYLYRTDNYDVRLAGLAVTIAFALNVSFVLEYHRFENRCFGLFRRMPFDNIQRIGYTAIVLLILCAPEILILIRNLPSELRIYDGILLFLYGLSICYAIYGHLYWRAGTDERSVLRTVMMSLLYFVLILFDTPLSAMILFNLLIGTVTYWYCYRKFEYNDSNVGHS
jgi:hypothetical protein